MEKEEARGGKKEEKIEEECCRIPFYKWKCFKIGGYLFGLTAIFGAGFLAGKKWGNSEYNMDHSAADTLDQ